MSLAPHWLTVFVDVPAAEHDANVAFWAAVTGTTVSAARGEHAQFATLVPPDGDAHLRTQRLAGGVPGHHLDLHVADPARAVDEAVALGVVLEDVLDGVPVLRTPAGLRLCLVAGDEARRSTPVAWPGGRSQVDQVCLDVPPSSYDAEVALWSALTGFEETPTTSSEFRRLDGPGPLRLLLQRLDDEGPASYHLDLSADGRRAEVARHLGLGARHVAEGRGWTVLAAPSGTAYCVTDRRPA